MTTFLQFLQDEHAKGYMGTDDKMPDAFEAWLDDIGTDGMLEYADEFLSSHRERLAGETDSKNRAYNERNRLVAFLASKYSAHIKIHPKEDTSWENDWRTIVCIHTPAGQMTWHIHDSETEMFGFLNVKPDLFPECEWDGHTTEEKYHRLSELGNPVAQKLRENI